MAFILSWKLERVPTLDAEQKCKAVIVEDIAGLGSSGFVTMPGVNKFASKFKDTASTYHSNGRFTFRCRIEATIDKDQIFKQLAALYHVTESTQRSCLFLK